MITTKRLFLIPWHASDANELYELAKDPEIGPLCGWEPHKTLEDSKQVLANVLSDKSCYAVKDMRTGHLIGLELSKQVQRLVMVDFPRALPTQTLTWP